MKEEMTALKKIFSKSKTVGFGSRATRK